MVELMVVKIFLWLFDLMKIISHELIIPCIFDQSHHRYVDLQMIKMWLLLFSSSFLIQEISVTDSVHI